MKKSTFHTLIQQKKIVAACLISFFMVIIILTMSQVSAEEIHSKESVANAPIELHKEGLPELFTWRIEGFDVSETGKILLLLENDHILVLNQLLRPEAWYSFDDKNGVNFVQWDKDQIVLYSAKRRLKVIYSVDGAFLSSEEYDTDDIEYMNLINTLFDKDKMQINGKTYKLKRDSGVYQLILLEGKNSYQSLLEISADGTQRVVYQGRSIAKQFWLYLFLIMILAIVTIYRIRAKKAGDTAKKRTQVKTIEHMGTQGQSLC